MALHHDLPVYRLCYQLVILATADAADTYAQGNSYLGHIGQTTHPHTQQAKVANTLRRRGHAVAGDLSKIYRRADA